MQPIGNDLLAQLYLDNNVNDEVGIYGWTNISGTPYSAGIVNQGTHSLGLIAEASGDYVTSSTAVAETVEAVHYDFYWPTGHDNINTFAWAASSGNQRIQSEANTIKIWNAGWTGGYGISDDTWYRVQAQFGGAGYGTKLFVDGIERGSGALNGQPTNQTHLIGVAHTLSNECDCYIDHFELYTSTQF